MGTKTRVLALLEQNKGAPLSGEALARALGVSRAAVWKAVKELRQSGYDIAAVTNRGYTLDENSDTLSAEGIRPYLACQTGQLVVEPCVASTNLVAKQLAVAGAPHGTLVVADSQTAGRGRLGRSFYSPPGTGLYLTAVVRHNLPMTSAVMITSAAAVAVCRALKEVSGKEAAIKWVNDVYIQGKKCCGILTEASTGFETGAVDFVIVGIGLNLFVPPGGFPQELDNTAAAIYEKGERVQRCKLAAAVANHLFALCAQLDTRAFMDEYRARNFVPGRMITILQNGNRRAARALSIDDAGCLLVELPDGACEKLAFGEVSVRL